MFFATLQPRFLRPRGAELGGGKRVIALQVFMNIILMSAGPEGSPMFHTKKNKQLNFKPYMAPLEFYNAMVPMVLLKPNLYFFVRFVLDTNTD